MPASPRVQPGQAGAQGEAQCATPGDCAAAGEAATGRQAGAAQTAQGHCGAGVRLDQTRHGLPARDGARAGGGRHPVGVDLPDDQSEAPAGLLAKGAVGAQALPIGPGLFSNERLPRFRHSRAAQKRDGIGTRIPFIPITARQKPRTIYETLSGMPGNTVPGQGLPGHNTPFPARECSGMAVRWSALLGAPRS